MMNDGLDPVSVLNSSFLIHHSAFRNRSMNRSAEGFKDLIEVYKELTQRYTEIKESEEKYKALAQKLEKEVKEGSKRLWEFEATYKTLVESAGDAIFTVDEGGNCISLNRIAARIIGGDPTDFVGKSIYKLFSNQEAELYKAHIEKIFSTGKGVIYEHSYKILGKTFWFSTSLDPIRDETGRIIYVLGVSRDMTQQKHVEKEKEVISNINRLIASSLDIKDVYKAISNELRKVLDFDRMAISLLEKDKTFFRIYALVRYYETSEADIQMEGTFILRTRTHLEEVIEHSKPLLIRDTSQSFYNDINSLLKEGIRSSLTYPLYYHGDVLGTISFASKQVDNFSEDVFELIKQITSQLAIAIENTRLFNQIKESEEKYRSFLSNAKDFIIYIVAFDGSSIYLNPVVEKILGYKPEEYYNDKNLWVSQIHPEDQARVFDAQKKALEGKGKSLEFRMIHRNKRDLRWLYASATAFKSDDGESTFLAGYAIDITEQKKLREQVQRSAWLASIGELAAGLAHEIRNPLLAIANSAKLLKQEKDLGEENRELMRIIGEESDRLNKIVTNFLQFARPRQPVFIEGDIYEVIDEVLRLLKKDTRWSNSINVLVDCESDLPKVRLDVDQMREVFWNLLINALEAMPDGGTIKIELSSTFTKGSRYLRVKISDTGVGIAPEQVTRIFEPFHTSKPQGTGLGLPIAHRIVEVHGGTLEVESKMGKGTTFILTLTGS
jgi:PAS domain S-box-containing protein